MLQMYPWGGMTLTQMKYIYDRFIESVDLSEEVGKEFLQVSRECKEAHFAETNILRILCMIHTKYESIRYEREVAEILSTQLNNF